MKLFIRLFLLASLSFPLYATPIYITDVVPIKPIKIVTLMDFKPFIWCEEEVAKGIDIEIVSELFLRVGREMNIECLPWKRALNQIKYGQSDALFSAYKNPQREKFATYLTSPLHTSVFNAFTHQDSELVYNRVEDFYGKRVGLSRGYSVNEAFDEAKENNKFFITEIKSTEAGIRMLLLDRIDVYINGKTVVLNKALEMGSDAQIKAMKKPMHEPKPAYLMFSKAAKIPQKEQLISDLNRELLGMWNDGTIQGIINTYTLPSLNQFGS